ncbi:SprT-like domain-containing protein [Candidatus Woesearchaeota archaeon]|nr:SprT-like domain-containing protein [Candidatus Woesearchaeota archaeon]
MSLIHQSYIDLTGKELKGSAELVYSGRFKGYNANIRMTKDLFGQRIEIAMSKAWEEVNDDIKKGLLQELLSKLFKVKTRTMEMDLYHSFLKNVHVAIPKADQDPHLLSVFQQLNEQYFHGLLDPPNLVWGEASYRQWGCYTYGTDTISMSSILQEHPDLLQYVLYHEMLHKKLKFACKDGRSHHHTPEFRALERAFPQQSLLEEKLKRLHIASRVSSRRKNVWRFWR